MSDNERVVKFGREPRIVEFPARFLLNIRGLDVRPIEGTSHVHVIGVPTRYEGVSYYYTFSDETSRYFSPNVAGLPDTWVFVWLSIGDARAALELYAAAL